MKNKEKAFDTVKFFREVKEKIAKETRGMTFEQFKEGSGKMLHDAYEEVKGALRVSKARQREIVSLVNNLKGQIDELTSLISELNPNPFAEEDVERRAYLQSQLDSAKMAYRGAHVEMQLCKKQITEAQTLKKRAMASLVSAFDHLATRTQIF